MVSNVIHGYKYPPYDINNYTPVPSKYHYQGKVNPYSYKFGGSNTVTLDYTELFTPVINNKDFH